MLYLIIISVITIFYLYSFILPIYKGAVYYPTKQQAINSMVKIAKTLHPKKVAELGSGDGRILRAFAREHISIDGFEINPVLYLFSNFMMSKKGLAVYAKTYRKNMWDVDLSEYDLIIVFGIGYIMSKLKNKFSNELKPNATVISNIFELPDVSIKEKINTLVIYNAKDIKK
jgi:hypothetical protein